MPETKTKPVYCKNCQSRDTWIRNPLMDVVGTVSGKVLWEAWNCKKCGNKTVCPVGDSDVSKN